MKVSDIYTKVKPWDSFFFAWKKMELNKEVNRGFYIALTPGIEIIWDGIILQIELLFLLWRFKWEWHFYGNE